MIGAQYDARTLARMARADRVAFGVGPGASSWSICLTVCAPHVAALGLQPLARRFLAKSIPDTLLCFATIVLPTCIAACLHDGYSLALLYAALLVPIAFNLRPNNSKIKRANSNQQLPALTQLRGAIALQTAFCILAVDFHIFPRALAKTLTFGRSVMDLGVGAVILAGALTHSKARAGTPSNVNVLRRHLPLLLIGVGRLLAVKATSYHEVHSEYGVHWNFFFTLGMVALIAPHLARGRSSFGCAVMACVLLCVHQTALSLLGFTDYVRFAPRTNLLSANKEGLASLPGYLALDLAGRAASYPLLHHAWSARQVISLDASLWLASWLLDAFVEPTSRQLCNAAYVLWVLAQVGLALGLAMLRSEFVQQQAPLPLLEAINRRPLSVFLLANLLTGAVNLSIDTMDVSDGGAAALLAVYMGVVCASAGRSAQHLWFKKLRAQFEAKWLARALEALRAELAEGKHGPPHRFELTATDPETMGHPDWTVVIEGPAGSLYEGQRFTLTVEFPPESPFKPPIIKLCSPIYHFSMGAHADGSSGRSSYICFLNGHDFKAIWSGTSGRSLWRLFDFFIDELSSPGSHGPHVELDTFKQWKERRAEFEAAARRCAQ